MLQECLRLLWQRSSGISKIFSRNFNVCTFFKVGMGVAMLVSLFH